jgi:hypothetical protein
MGESTCGLVKRANTVHASSMVSTAAAHTFLVMWQEEDQASCQHRQACEDCLRRIVPGQVARLHCKGCQQATYPAERVIQAQTKVAYSRGIPAGQTKKSRIEPMIQHTLCSRRVLAELQPMGLLARGESSDHSQG